MLKAGRKVILPRFDSVSKPKGIYRRALDGAGRPRDADLGQKRLQTSRKLETLCADTQKPPDGRLRPAGRRRLKRPMKTRKPPSRRRRAQRAGGASKVRERRRVRNGEKPQKCKKAAHRAARSANAQRGRQAKQPGARGGDGEPSARRGGAGGAGKRPHNARKPPDGRLRRTLGAALRAHMRRGAPAGRRRPILPRACPAVLSAMEGLTAGFGMGPGVPPPPWPPARRGPCWCGHPGGRHSAQRRLSILGPIRSIVDDEKSSAD